MGTTAVFAFTSDSSNQNVKNWVVSPSDGHQSGAAIKLYKALMYNSWGNLATNFIRANPKTFLVEPYSTAEYRYEIDGDFPNATLSVYHKVLTRTYFPETATEKGYWKNQKIWTGPLMDFIDFWVLNVQMENDENVKETIQYSPFMQVNCFASPRWLNLHLAQKELDYAKAEKERFGQDESSSHFEKIILEITKVFPELQNN